MSRPVYPPRPWWPQVTRCLVLITALSRVSDAIAYRTHGVRLTRLSPGAHAHAQRLVAARMDAIRQQYHQRITYAPRGF